MAFSVSSRNRLIFAWVTLALGAAAGLVLWSGVRKEAPVPWSREGDAHLVSIQPLPEMDGAMCELLPASSAGSVVSWLRQESKTEAKPESRPSEAARAEAARRAPVRVIQDTTPAFSAVALDLTNDEVVLQDENTFGLNIYNRLDNTPPTARMTEPKRTIRGENTHLEFNCGLYVDPANGDIYSVNNDTLNLLTVFGRDARGNAEPKRVLRAPYFYGIAMDEERQEMLLSAQGNVIAVWKKDAKGDDRPVRFIKGNKTSLADPHGMALDAQRGLIFVTNWGTHSDIEIAESAGIPWGDGRAWGSSGGGGGPGRAIRGTGKVGPPSITVYPKDAMGDVAPLRVIQGPKTQMNWPTAVAVDPVHGELFVANDTGDSVTVYNIEAQGDVAPLRVLKGPKSMIKSPTGLAYDPKNDELWVANFGNHSATVFRRTASGDAAPLRVIRSAPLDQPAPMMGNPHVLVYDEKREQILVSQ